MPRNATSNKTKDQKSTALERHPRFLPHPPLLEGVSPPNRRQRFNPSNGLQKRQRVSEATALLPMACVLLPFLAHTKDQNGTGTPERASSRKAAAQILYFFLPRHKNLSKIAVKHTNDPGLPATKSCPKTNESRHHLIV